MSKNKGIALIALFLTLLVGSCKGPDSGQEILTADMPLHLEDHLDKAHIVSSEVPKDIPKAVEWRFDEPQPDWKPAIPLIPAFKPAKIVRTEEAMRVILSESDFLPYHRARGGIYVDLPGWHRGEWAYIKVQARTSDKVRDFRIGVNLKDMPKTLPARPIPFLHGSEEIPVINDGFVQTYLIEADYTYGEEREKQWEQLGIWFWATEPSSIEVLSVSVIPKEAGYAGAAAGVSKEIRGDTFRRTLFTHVPGRLEYKVRIPEAGRLDVGLGVVRKDIPVTFRINAKSQNEGVVSLLEETYIDQGNWAQRSVDLSHLSGQVVILAFEAEANRAGMVALWSAPTLTGKRFTKKPNIMLYVIDGAGADHMSVYGYNRRTTPHLERLAAEGTVFEHAFSNSTWTKVSNPSFMTSLHNSVLGGYLSDSDPLPNQAITISQRLHRMGYQTGAFLANSYAGTMSGLERGVDVLREVEFEPHTASSKELQKHFWMWREDFPGEPYWVHFQTADVHGWNWKPVAPFAGLFISPEERERFYKWQLRMIEAGNRWGNPYLGGWEKNGIDPLAFSNARWCLYDEGMAHNDYQIGQLVNRLKAVGEWDHTLLVVTADHGYNSAGIGPPHDPKPPKWGRPIFASYHSRIPMIFVWPGKIVPGQRISQPVSMIDMLPTILDLVDLPVPEVIQGQSLAPLLLGVEGWEPRPVILDEFEVDRETGELVGKLEVVDGRWGASLYIGPEPEEKEIPSEERRPAPLLIYDLWDDPYCIHSLHEQRPDLVEKYSKFLQAKWQEHRELAKRFSRSGSVTLTPEQLRILRSLGYIE